HSTKAQRIFSSIENNKNNQQLSKTTKQRYIKYTYCQEIGHNIRCCKTRLADEAN
ncbi:22960_t:CDS:1, partial [Racocetra persica]